MSGKDFITKSLANHGVPKRSTVDDLTKQVNMLNLGKRERSKSKSNKDSLGSLTRAIKKIKIGRKLRAPQPKSDRMLRSNRKKPDTYKPSKMTVLEKARRLREREEKSKKQEIKKLENMISNINIKKEKTPSKSPSPKVIKKRERSSPEATYEDNMKLLNNIKKLREVALSRLNKTKN